MRKVDRTAEPPPRCLSDERTTRAREQLRAIFGTDNRKLAQNRVSLRSFLVQDPEIDQALTRLFNKRCAFCEQSRPTRAYRFRPIEEAGPSSAAPPGDADRSHLYYCWLVNSWQNLYPICDDCRPREESVFPTLHQRCPIPSRTQIRSYVDRAPASWPHPIDETPLLLDPCGSDTLARHLTALPGGELVGLSSRGEFTIEHFSLNRQQLVEERRSAYSFHLDELGSILSGRSSFSDVSELFDQDFGGTGYMLLREIAKKLVGGKASSQSLSPKVIGRFFAKQFKLPSFDRRLRDAFDELLHVPEQVHVRRKRSRRPLRGDARPVAFTIENYKALEKIEIKLPAQSGTSTAAAQLIGRYPGSELAPAIVILGENAAGKSSILEGMALALSEQDARDDLKLVASDCILNPEWMGGRAGRRPAASLKVRYENGDEATVAVGAGFPFREGRDLARIPVFAYGAFRLFRKVDRRTRPSARIRSLFELDYVLPNPEPWLVSLAETPLFEEVARALKMILAIDQAVDVIDIDRDRQECALVVSTTAADGGTATIRTPLSAVSSGFRAVLAMTCDVMRGLTALQSSTGTTLAKTRAVVLIDEVEAHLHPRWKMRIIQGLREALPGVTFIMTTHDPLCLRGLAPSEVRVFRRIRRTEQYGLPPTFVEQLEELPPMGGLTVEQLLTSDLFQLHTTDAPALEDSFARFGDLLAREQAGELISGDAGAALQRARMALRSQIGDAIPVGSTEVERLIQEAVERYLLDRRGKSHSELTRLRDETRDAIIAALGDL
ncbi:AAA family ATPase [Methylobacterium brachythecii]|uniref:ATPase AAA-type core domain-containing protein n=1 Tax=Methylobacterium brachythecii TaxID=1176177 RepID=A0A7W6AIE9_9HYPH|nr:ATP-binding protein [Methylobacterium brachythecii]MBB3903940.1 hypothetical protein [Methylobacterium brachythecii]GLS42687.1 hypothetical protein GCM10007884_06720 [Methylobacterium brachythecii]